MIKVHIVLFVVLIWNQRISAQQRASRTGGKPNIILILTDDQDVELGSLNYMPKTLKAIKYQGAEFRHAYVTTPMCCPSRSSLLTGMYVHNHNVFTNNDNCSSTHWQTTYETRSFATYLSNAGYRTGYFGKYLNKYNGSYIPPGWREWGGLIMNSKYYNYSINMNGKKIKHGFDYAKDYYPDLIANDSIAFLRQSKKNNAHKPVMLTMSFPSPHGPEDSAPQYSNLFFNVTSHHIPSYDHAPNPDKQWILKVTKKMQPIHKEFTDLLMTKRLQTLQSVDAAVQRVVEELANLGELHNTYIIYTSDHGYHLGQFGLIKGKSFPFEFDVRVPFLMRGPGIDPGAVIDEIVLNIDLAPTFLDLAGVETPPHMDGRSILPLLMASNRKRLKWPDTFLIESSGRRETPHYDAKMKKNVLLMNTTLSTSILNYSYISSTTPSIDISSHPSINLFSTTPNKVYDSEEEDDNNDSNIDEDTSEASSTDGELRSMDFSFQQEITEEELTNQDTPPTHREQSQLDNRVLPGFIPLDNKLERLAKECAQTTMRKPCAPHQKWFCELDNGRWRKHKCKSIVLNHLPTTGRYKKCACFTPRGLVYKKIAVHHLNKRIPSSRARSKRDVEFNELILELMDKSDKLTRNKRNTLEHVENAMKDVNGQINELQMMNNGSFYDDLRTINLETNLIGVAISGCVLLNKGKVNCSNQVYQDKKIWQKSRHEVNNEIQELKIKLEKLKEIRRHLKHFRPNDLANENRPWTENKLEVINNFPFSSNISPSAERVQHRRKHKKPVNLDSRRHPKRMKNVSSTSTESALKLSSTLDPVTKLLTTGGSTEIHRHKHQKHETTTIPVFHRAKMNVTNKPKSPDEIPYPLQNCHCEGDNVPKDTEFDDKEEIKRIRKKLKDEKLRKKLRKQKRKEQMEKTCSSERMNCFVHDNNHWRTEPLWTSGPFCFCMNANNNTYSCVRTINSTHNFLYCEFTTGLVTYYNLRIDPFELQNRVDQLKPEEKLFLHNQLQALVACKGSSCTINQNTVISKRNNFSSNKMVAVPHHFRYKKRKVFDNPRNGHSNQQNKHLLRFANTGNYTHIENRLNSSSAIRRKRKLVRDRCL